MWAEFDESPTRDEPTPEITDLNTIVIDGNFPWTLVTVETDQGVTGIGEAYPSPGVHEVITDYLRPVLVGENPLDVERLYYLMRESLWSRLAMGNRNDRNQWRRDRSVGRRRKDSRSADLPASGRQAARGGQSIRRLPRRRGDGFLGPGRTRRGTYQPEAYAQAARMAVDDGFDMVKFDLDVPSGREVDTLAAL